MQSVIKDFLERLSSTPPPSFWRYQNDTDALAAQLEIAKLNISSSSASVGNTNDKRNNSSNNNGKNQLQQLQQYIPLATTTLAKSAGHTVFSQLQGAIKHGGKPSLTAFQNLTGGEKCLEVCSSSSSTTTKSSSASTTTTKANPSNNNNNNNNTSTLLLESLANGDEGVSKQNEDGDQKKVQPKSENLTTCSCRADDPSLCPCCHESLRVTLWKLYSLTTCLFAYRESCNQAITIASQTSNSNQSTTNRSNSNNNDNSQQNNFSVQQQQQQQQRNSLDQAMLNLPSVFVVAEASKQARSLVTRVFLFARKLSHRWTSIEKHDQERQYEKAKPKQNNNNNKQEDEIQVNFHDNDEENDNSAEVVDSKRNSFEASKFYSAVLMQHSIQIAVDVLAMLATGFDTESSAPVKKFGAAHMDRLSSKEFQNAAPPERRLAEVLCKLRETAITTLSQSLLLTRETLVSAFVFAKHCHSVMIIFDDPFSAFLKEHGSELAGNFDGGCCDSDDSFDDDDDQEGENDLNNNNNKPRRNNRSSSFLQSEDELKALASAQTLVSERQERSLIQIELSALKYSGAVLCPPTLFDVKNIDERGEHSSSFVAGELCDPTLETPHIYTGVQRQQISISIVNRVTSLLEHEEKQYIELQREKQRSRIADPFGKIRKTGEEARREEEIANQVAAARVRQTKLTEQYTTCATRFLLNIASHDLWSSFTKLPSQVRANRIQQHNHQQMMMMLQKEQQKKQGGRRSSGAPSIAGDTTSSQIHMMSPTNNNNNSFLNTSGVYPTSPSSNLDNSQGLGSFLASPNSKRTKSAGATSRATTRNQNEETTHGTVILHPARKNRIASFFGHLTVQELERFSAALSNFATAFPVLDEEERKKQQTSAHTMSVYEKQQEQKKKKYSSTQETCALPMYGNLSAADRKNTLACLISIHWCLYREEEFVPGAFASLAQANKKLGVLSSPTNSALMMMMTTSAVSPTHDQQQKTISFANGGMANDDRIANLFPFSLSSPSNRRNNYHNNAENTLMFSPPPALLLSTSQQQQQQRRQSGTPAGAVNFAAFSPGHNNNVHTLSPTAGGRRSFPTKSDAWQSGLFNLSTVSLSVGLSHFHSIGLTAHCAAMAKHDPLSTGLTMAQHRGVLHVPIGDDIFVDSGFMPVVKGRSSNIALEAPPCHPIDPQDYAPGLAPNDRRSTISAVLNATLLAPPREELFEKNQNSNNNNHSNNNNNNHVPSSSSLKSEAPCEVTGMASVCTTTLIAVAAPRRSVARIPFSSVKVGSLHKNTANALNNKTNNNNSDTDGDHQQKSTVAGDQNGINNNNNDENDDEEENKFFDDTIPVVDPDNSKSASQREQHLDLDRSLVILNCARHVANIQVGVRSEIVGVLTEDSFSNEVAQRSFSVTGFIFTVASEGVTRTSMRPEWYRLGLFAAEYAEKQKRPPLHHPIIHGDKTKEDLEKQRARAAEDLFGADQSKGQQLTLAEKRKQRWTDEASLHERRAKSAAKKRRRAKSGSKSPTGASDSEFAKELETAEQRHQKALDSIEEGRERELAAEAIISRGEAPDFVQPQIALEEAHAVAARKAALLEEELSQMRRERDEALALVRDLRTQADVVATCVIPPLQSEVRLMRHLLGQTLGALRASEAVCEKQNEKLQGLESKMLKVVNAKIRYEQQSQFRDEEAANSSWTQDPEELLLGTPSPQKSVNNQNNKQNSLGPFSL